MFDNELEIVRMELAERFAVACNPVSNVKWAGKGVKVKILEFAGALFRLGELTACDGTKLSFADIVLALCIAFNVDVPNMYIQRYQNRERFKGAAQFLRRLVAVLEKDAIDML